MGFLRGRLTVTLHWPLKSDRETLTAGARRQEDNESRDEETVRGRTKLCVSVCVRGSVGEKQVLPVLLKCVCAHARTTA